MGAARRRLWEHLHGLHARAVAARAARGRSATQAAAARELRKSGGPGLRRFSGQRISDWVPAEAADAVVPQARSDDQVVALAELWAAWASEPARGRVLRGLLDAARDEQARERATGTPARTPAAHRSIRTFTPWQLEVRAAALPGPATAPALTPYLIRSHDHALREYLKSAATGGPSALGVLTGDSSTGKTRALYEAVLAVAPDHRLLCPPTARALLALLADGEVAEGSVLWLNELQRLLHDSEGNEAAVELTAALRATPGIVAVAALWEVPYWNELTAQGLPGDPARHTRPLLVGDHVQRFRVPRRLSATELGRWRDLAAEHEDPRLRSAGRAGSADGQVVQHLSGGPVLLDAYLSGPGSHFTPREHALVTAAIEARRLGHQAPLPGPLLAAAADGALDPHDRAPRADWAGPELTALTDGIRSDGSRADALGTLTPLRAVRASAGAPPGHDPSDYLLQHAAPRPGTGTAAAALWEALVRHTEGVEDLYRLQDTAWKHALCALALRLDRRAALAGSTDACVRIAGRTARHPDAAQAAAWAVAHADLADHAALDRLFAALRASGTGESGTREAVDALGHRLVAATDPSDIRAAGELAVRLSRAGVSSGVTAALDDVLAGHIGEADPADIVRALPGLFEAGVSRCVGPLAHRAAAHVDLGSRWCVTRLVHVLRTVGATDAAAVLAVRIERGAAELDPDELPWLMAALWDTGAEPTVRALLALAPAARIRPTRADVVLELLRVLRATGDDDGVRALLARSPARHVDVSGEPDLFDIASLLCLLLAELSDLGADEEVAVLADRVAAEAEAECAEGVAGYLDWFHATGRTDQARLLLRRVPLSGLDYYDPEELRSLLLVLKSHEAAAFDVLAASIAADVQLTSPEFVGEVVRVLWETGGERGIAPLVDRALTHRPVRDVVFVPGELAGAGLERAAARVAEHVASHIETPDMDLDLLDFVLAQFVDVGATDAVRIVSERGLLDDISRYRMQETPSYLVDTLSRAGAREAAHAFAHQVAATLDLDDTYGIGSLLAALRAHDLSAPRDLLVRRAAAGARLTHMNSVARLIEEFLAAGDTDAVAELLRRDPLATVDEDQATDTCHAALVAALRAAGDPGVDAFARRARASGRLPVEPCPPYGVTLDGAPAAPWTWDDLAVGEEPAEPGGVARLP